MKEIRDALRKHNHTYLYEQVVGGKKKEIIELAVEEFLQLKLDGDDEGADNVLISAYHSSISASDLGLAIYIAGRNSN